MDVVAKYNSHDDRDLPGHQQSSLHSLGFEIVKDKLEEVGIVQNSLYSGDGHFSDQ